MKHKDTKAQKEGLITLIFFEKLMYHWCFQ